MVRFKNRYITVEIVCRTVDSDRPLPLKSGALSDAVLEKVQYIHGDYGVAAIRYGFIAKYCNENTKIAILRARHGPHKYVTSSIPFVTQVGKLDVTLRTLHVGATMKHSYKFIVSHQKAYLDSMYLDLKSDEERKFLLASAFNFSKTDEKINIENMT